MKVQTKKIGVVSDLVRCSDCDWTYEALYDGEIGLACRHHVKFTGHSVSRETATSTHYEPKEQS